MDRPGPSGIQRRRKTMEMPQEMVIDILESILSDVEVSTVARVVMENIMEGVMGAVIDRERATINGAGVEMVNMWGVARGCDRWSSRRYC